MKRINHRKILRCFIVASLAIGSCVVSSRLAFAEEALAPGMLAWQKLHQKAELNKPVTIESVRQPLHTILAEVSRQANVELVLSEELAQANKLIIVRANEMPLFDFMAAVARTYVAQWHEVGANRYELGLQKTSEVDVTIAQIGTPLFYRYRDKTEPEMKESQQARNALYDQIVGELGLENLSSRDGVAVNALSAETSAKLRAIYEQEQAFDLLTRQKGNARALSPNLVLHIDSSQTAFGKNLQHINFPEEIVRKRAVITFGLLDEKKEHLLALRPFEWTLGYNQIYGPQEKVEEAR